MMKHLFKIFFCVIALFVFAYISGAQQVDNSIRQLSFEADACCVSASSVAIGDLFSEVVCSSTSVNTINFGRRLPSVGGGSYIPTSTLAEKFRSINHPIDSHYIQTDNLSVITKSQSLYYIYALRRIRI